MLHSQLQLKLHPQGARWITTFGVMQVRQQLTVEEDRLFLLCLYARDINNEKVVQVSRFRMRDEQNRNKGPGLKSSRLFLLPEYICLSIPSFAFVDSHS